MPATEFGQTLEAREFESVWTPGWPRYQGVGPS
jgi:hypothetical protein